MTNYMLYRSTTLGNTLEEALDDLLAYDQISHALAVKVLLQFDKAMSQALTTQVHTNLEIKANKLKTYRFCDNVWTLMLDDVEFRDAKRDESIFIDKVKIVACEAEKTLDAPSTSKAGSSKAGSSKASSSKAGPSRKR